MKNPVQQLQEVGQSIWLDNLSRQMIESGELNKWIELGIRGITSNPTIFQKAIAGSKNYDSSIQRLGAKGISDAKEIFISLALEDISRAAERLWPIYQQSNGLDGLVSIEVSPDLADDTEQTVLEAKRLFTTINKKNILIKVPATPPGLPAIEQLIRDGVNVNVTLLFSVDRYQKVAEAFLRGLEQRSQQGLPLEEIVSVASFFVSRVDTLVDGLLQARLSSAAAEAEREKIKSNLGKAAIANAKIAYGRFREIFAGPRFRKLKGAKIQRILWGSTGTKNPGYSDVKYVEELIGPDSINTLPEGTIRAFLDHGKAQNTIGDRLDEAQRLFTDLKTLGIEMEQVTAQLEKEGVQLFSDSFFSLLKEISVKRDSFTQS